MPEEGLRVFYEFFLKLFEWFLLETEGFIRFWLSIDYTLPAEDLYPCLLCFFGIFYALNQLMLFVEFFIALLDSKFPVLYGL